MALTRTPDELSIVSSAESVPASVTNERNWRALRVTRLLDLLLVGIFAALSGVLAQVQVPIFALSTFDTDYLFVADRDLERAVRALEAAGHRVVPVESVPDAVVGQR